MRSVSATPNREHVGVNQAQPANSEGIPRPTDELVIGIVGAVGAGVSFAANILENILIKEYKYTVRLVKASKIIEDQAFRVDKEPLDQGGAKRIKDRQDIGTKLRDKFGENYIAAKAIEDIAISRKTDDGYSDEKENPQPLPRRHATIIDSLKHPEETKLLRDVYGHIYWQFTIFAPESIREHRLNAIGISKGELHGIFTRDENDKEGAHGQKVTKTAYLSDFFIRNDSQNDQRLNAIIRRYLSLIFNVAIETPNKDETGMQAAVFAASKSACLSRQVGAAIYSNNGELISVGWNDVPRANGGLYSSEDKDEDHRCYKWGEKVCHNDRKKEALYEKIYNLLSDKKLIDPNVNMEDLRSSLKETPLKDLIEYSRSIHAEMEAIMAASRSGKIGIVGGTLYTTTFPCHNCARHIVAAGISKVYYIEPYAKSLALELHSDSIGTTPDSTGNKVAFLQYEGVAPRNVLKLFQHGVERKVRGKACAAEAERTGPVRRPPLDSFATHEKRVLQHVESLEDRRTMPQDDEHERRKSEGPKPA